MALAAGRWPRRPSGGWDLGWKMELGGRGTHTHPARVVVVGIVDDALVIRGRDLA
jgi:hypothetical protein